MQRKRVYGNKRAASKSLSMPARKRSKSARNRSSWNRNAKSYGSEYNLYANRANVLARPVFGTQYTCQVRYFERGFSIDPSIGGVAASHVFSANGLFDPDITGVGHQPSGFDQLMTFYDHYTVTHAKITVTAKNQDSALSQLFGIYVQDNTVAVTDPRVIIENGMGVYTQLNTLNSTGDSTQLSHSVNVARWMGRPSILSEDELRGTNGSNPADGLYFHVWAAPISLSNSEAVGINVRVDYTVTFTEPRLIPIS